MNFYIQYTALFPSTNVSSMFKALKRVKFTVVATSGPTPYLINSLLMHIRYIIDPSTL